VPEAAEADLVMPDASPTEENRCILCGSVGRNHSAAIHDREVLPAGQALPGSDRVWALANCRSCSLYWLHPRPTAADFEELYGAGYYTHATAQAGPLPRPSRLGSGALRVRYGYRRLAPGLFARAAAAFGPVAESAGAEVRFLAARPGGRLLDVGCGNGEYLALMQALGWDVRGVEPDPNAVRSARPSVRDRIVTGTVEDAPFPKGRFDAITLHHVIEHLPDPIRTLRCCAALLRPGGRLVVITPNANSLGRRIFGATWLHWDPPRHTFIFTRGSLKAVAEKAGLEIASQWTLARAARWTWQESRRLRRGRSRPEAGVPGRARTPAAVAFQMLQYTTQPIGRWGEELVLIASH
jgi:SAM-dependent methyltransferase